MEISILILITAYWFIVPIIFMSYTDSDLSLWSLFGLFNLVAIPHLYYYLTKCDICETISNLL